MKSCRLINKEAPMRCSKRKLISPYIDGELNKDKRSLLESHLNGCRECARELEELQKIHMLLAGAEPFEVPHGFSTRVLANIRAKEKRRSADFVHILKTLTEGFAVLVLIVVGIILGSYLSKTLAPEKGNVVASLSLDIFAPAPPDSVGGVYIAMMETNNEK
jgi:anti-sigma factor RsiW